MKVGLLLMKNVLKPLAASAADSEILEKVSVQDIPQTAT